MLVFASRFFLVVAIGLLMWAGWWILFSGDRIATAGALTIESPERDLGEQSVGVHIVKFRIRNNSEQPHRIIGFEKG